MTDSPVLPASAPSVVRERVRWSDVDAAGIVCYGSYLRFLELAESEMFRHAGLTAGTLADTHRLWLVRRRIECDFLLPVLLDEELVIGARVTAVGRSSVELAFRAARVGDAAPALAARYVLVAVARDSLQPIPVPDPVRAVLASMTSASPS